MEIIEKLNDWQIEQLSDMYEKTWFTPNRSIKEINTMLDNSYLVLGFIVDGKLVGFCRAISDGVYKAFLFDVIIHDDYQNKGFGSKLVDIVLNHKKLANVGHIELYCPEKVTPFYKRLGFDTRDSLLMRYTR